MIEINEDWFINGAEVLSIVVSADPEDESENAKYGFIVYFKNESKEVSHYTYTLEEAREKAKELAHIIADQFKWSNKL